MPKDNKNPEKTQQLVALLREWADYIEKEKIVDFTISGSNGIKEIKKSNIYKEFEYIGYSRYNFQIWYTMGDDET